MEVWLAGRRVRLDPARAIGKGGEADVYDLGDGRALKVFKTPRHPDVCGDTAAEEAARQRLELQQRKLPAFPHDLPERVVVPAELALDRRHGHIAGYTMRLLAGADPLYRWGERPFREALGPDLGGERVSALFRDLHATVSGLHAHGVVIGDFNDLNVLCLGEDAHLIDADSFQFGPFPCAVYTERFVDPLLCDPHAERPVLVRPLTPLSDWYAYAVLLTRALLLVDPYGGVLKPGALPQALPPLARPLRRITIFHPAVRYPRAALPYDSLPDELLELLQRVFVRDARLPFPVALLDDLRLTRCSACGAPHARRTCPRCATAPPAAVREVVTVRGAIRATRLFVTRGRILDVTHDGTLRVLHLEDGCVRREDGRSVFTGRPDARLALRLCGEDVLAGLDGLLVRRRRDGTVERRSVDTADGAAAFTTNGRHVYWASDGQLLRDGHFGPERIGDVLSPQTRIWVGPTFGLGLTRAGELALAFVFDAEARGLNDNLVLPRLRGRLLDARCAFDHDRCWFVATVQEGTVTRRRCALVGRDGSLLASDEAVVGDGSWLGELGGACAAAGLLFVTSDQGLSRVERDAGHLVRTRLFPDSEPFVDVSSRLLAAPDGLLVVGEREIVQLRIA